MKKHLLAFLALFGLAASANAATVTLTSAGKISENGGTEQDFTGFSGISSGSEITKSLVLNKDITINTNGKYYNTSSDKSIRLYSSGNSNFEIQGGTGIILTKIEISFSNNPFKGTVYTKTAEDANYPAKGTSYNTAVANTPYSWSSAASNSINAVKFVHSGNVTRVKEVTITYETAGPEIVANPTISNVKGLVTLGCSTTGATIMYHVGEAAVTDASACTDEYKNTPFSVTKGQWVSAYAKKDGATASKVISKQITWEIGNVTTTPAAVNEDITISEGTSIIFASENADKLAFKVDDEAEETVDNPYTYTPAKDVIVTVTPVDNGTKVEDKTAVFTITIKQAEVWTLVTSLRDMPLDGQYIIANEDGNYAMSTTPNATFIPPTSITIDQTGLKDPSAEVLRFTIEKEGEKYYWKTANIADESYYLSAPATAKSNELYRKETSNGDVTATNVSFTNGSASIKFVNCLYDNKQRIVRYNSNSGQERFATYYSPASTFGLVKLYRLGGTPMPTRTQNADGSVVFVSTVGELHVIVENRDKNNKPIAAAGQSMMARAASENPWTNKVADANVEYTIPVPVEPVHHIYVEAKSVNGTFHSEVDKFTLDQSGTTTGITAVEAEDADAPVEYYNMQGVRVMNPAQGLYIRRQGNRVEKVALR